MTWRDSAACLGASTDWFFPTTGNTVTKAQRLCNMCPVINECNDYANSRDVFVPYGDRGGSSTVMGKFGVWGGLSHDERMDQQSGGARVGRFRQ